MTCWEILGLAPGATQRDIKRRYAQLIKTHRPEDDPAVYQRLRDAYEKALSWEEEPPEDKWDERPVVQNKAFNRIIPGTFPLEGIRLPVVNHTRLQSLSVGEKESWQSILDQLFLANESVPEEAEIQLADAIAALSALDLKSRLQFEEHLVVNLSRVFRLQLMLAAAEKFKWRLMSAGENQAARQQVNDTYDAWLLIEAEIAPLFFSGMSASDGVESGIQLKNLYQRYADDKKNTSLFDAAVLLQTVKYDLSSTFLAFVIELIEWSLKSDEEAFCWGLTARFHRLALVHKQGYHKLITTLNTQDERYYGSRVYIGYLTAAEQKHALSRYQLGRLFYAGGEVPQDDQRAFFWFSCAAKQGHQEAQHVLGVCCREGKGTEQNFSQALFWLQQSAAQDNLIAQYELGRLWSHDCAGKPDYIQAFYWLNKAAQRGLSDAQNDLGSMYYTGKTGEKDFQQAFHWFTLAAGQNNSIALYNLGVFHRDGIHGTVDKSLAFAAFLKAAMQGYAPAQNEVAIIYYHGELVEKNYTTAIEWYTKAAEQDDVIAQYNLGVLFSDRDVMEPDFLKTEYWLTLAAKQGHSDAQFKLGLMYCEGKDILRDMSKSLFWFNQAAKQGDCDSILMLAKIYARGQDDIEQDYTQSFFWYEKAAKLGEQQAQHIVALMYFGGFGTEQNTILAWVWMSISATPHPKLDIKDIRRKLSRRDLAKAEEIARQYIEQYQLS